MKIEVLATTATMMLLATPAVAASLCNCCGAATVESCSTACSPVKPAEGQCIAAVDYAGTAEIGNGSNPLYSMSLRDVWLGTPKRMELEKFRRFLEQARAGAERDRRVSVGDFRRKKIDQATAAARGKQYDDAIVNYYLGLHSYRSAIKNL